jgi:hypothetical protein
VFTIHVDGDWMLTGWEIGSMLLLMFAIHMDGKEMVNG